MKRLIVTLCLAATTLVAASSGTAAAQPNPRINYGIGQPTPRIWGLVRPTPRITWGIAHLDPGDSGLSKLPSFG